MIIADSGMFRMRNTQRTDGISDQLYVYEGAKEGGECVIICVAGGMLLD